MRNRKVFVFLFFISLVVLAVSVSTYKISVDYNNKAGNIEGFGRYLDGNDVTLVAIPKEGYEFSRWIENGMQVATVSRYHFNANKNRELVAEFKRRKYKVRVKLNNSSVGEVKGEGIYKHGEEVTIKADIDEKYDIKLWLNIPEDSVIKDNEIRFNITSDLNIRVITDRDLKIIN